MAVSFPIEIKNSVGVVEIAETWYGTRRVLVDGVKAEKRGAAKWAVPLRNGREEVILVGGIPGFPKVLNRGRVIYQTPFPSGADAGLAFGPLAAAFVEPYSGIPLGVIGMGINMRNLHRDDWSRVKKVIVCALVTVGIVGISTGILLWIKVTECMRDGSC